MNDQFFEEEEELARAEAAEKAVAKRAPKAAAQAAGNPAVKRAPKAAQPAAGGPNPPSFARVCVIAAVALLLGVCIGYFAAMMAVGGTVDAEHSTTSTTTVVTTTGEGDASAASTDASGMPSDHPDITSMINADGTVNEEALAAYKAQRAAEQGSQDVDASGSGDAASEDSSAE